MAEAHLVDEVDVRILADLVGLAKDATLTAILAELDVALSTRASEATILAILTKFDVALSTRASEATLGTRASEVTVAGILAKLDVALSTRASAANQTSGAQKTQIVDGGGTTLGVPAAPVRTDPTGTTSQPVDDGGGSLTVDGAVTTIPSGTQDVNVVGNAVGLATNATLSAQRAAVFHQGTASADGNVSGLDALDSADYSVVDIHIQGVTFPPSFDFIVQIQGTNHPSAAAGDAATVNGWAALPVVTPAGATVTSIKNPGRFLLLQVPRKIRVRISSFVSGSAQIDLVLKPVPEQSPNRRITDKDGLASWQLTAFGTGKVASPLFLVGGTFDGTALDNLEWKTEFVGSGSAVVGGGQVRLRTGVTIDSVARVTSRKNMAFLGDVENEVTIVAKFGDLGTPSNRKRIGVYDENNGFFIEQYHDGSSGKLRAITRKDGVDTVDTLFPLGVVKPTNTLSFQFWRFVYQPGFILCYQGSNLVHLFITGTTGIEPLFSKFHLPLRATNTNDGGGTGDTSLYVMSMSGSRLGVQDVRQVLIGEKNRFTTPLGAGASVTGEWDLVEDYPALTVVLKGAPFNAQGTLYFEFTEDVTLATPTVSVPVSISDLSVVVPIPLINVGPFFRLRYENGSTPQTEFRLHVLLYRTDPGIITRTPAQQIGPNEPVKVVRALVEPSLQGDRGLLGADREVFGAAVTASRSNTVEADFSQPLAANRVVSTVSGGGATAQANGQATMTSGAGATASARLQSVGSVRYTPGAEVFVVFTSRFTTPTHASTHQRAGLYDDNNGFFLGYQGLTFGFTVRKAGVDTFVALADVNGDPLDASFRSRFARGGVLEPLDPTKINVWRIRFGWLGSSVIQFELQSPDGSWMHIHTVRHPNTSTGPSIESPRLPMRMEVVKSAADATSLVIGSGSWAAGVAATPTLSDFSKLLQRVLANTDELMLDVEPTSADFYIGKAPDGTSAAAGEWDVIKIYLSATRNPTRIRFRQNVVWNDRTLGWT